MKKIMGDKPETGFLDDFDKFSKWLEQKDEVKKKKEEENKKKKAQPPTFSVLSLVIILTGLGPLIGPLAMALQAQVFQYALDTIRMIH